MKTLIARNVRSLALPLIVVFSAVLSAAENKPLPAADILPDGTVLYTEISPWKNWSADFANTSLSKIFEEPEVRTFLSGPFARITSLLSRSSLPGGPELPATMKINPPSLSASFFNMMEGIAPGPFTAAVRYSPEDAMLKHPPAWAFVAGIADEGNNIENRSTNVLALIESLLRDSKIEIITVTDYQNSKLLSVRSLTPKDGVRANLCSLVLHKSRLVVSNDAEFCKQIMDGLSGTLPRKLSDTAAFKNTGLTGNEHLSAYLDIAGLQKAIGSSEKPTPDKTSPLDDFFALAGLDQTSVVAWSLKMNGPAFESRTAIFSKGERGGLIGSLEEEALSADALKLAPISSPLVMGMRLKKDRIVPLVRNAIKAAQGAKGAEHFDEAVKAMAAEGNDLAAGVKEAFGNEFVVTSLAGSEIIGQPNMVPAVAASLSVTDPAKAEALLVKLLTKLAARMDGNGTPTSSLHEVEGTKIRYLKSASLAGALGVTPAFVIAENRLLFALDVPSLKRAMRYAKEGGGLANSERFKASMQSAGGNTGSFFSYIDYGFIYKSAFSLAATTLNLVAPPDVLRAVGLDMDLLPETERVTQHLFPAVSVAHISPSGVVMTSHSPLPSAEVLTPPLAALTAIYASFAPVLKPNGAPAPAPQK